MGLLNKNTPRSGVVNDVTLAFKKANSISLLPSKVETFYNTFVMRVLRFLGGISMVLVLTGRYTVLFTELQTPVLIMAFIHSTTIIIISSIKLVYGLHILINKPETFEVRNSPLNPISTQLVRLITCAKYGCQGIAVGTGILAGAVTYDTILAETGRDTPQGVPFIGKIYNPPLRGGEPMTPQNHQNLRDAVNTSSLTKDDILRGIPSLSPQEQDEIAKIVQEERDKRSGKK